MDKSKTGRKANLADSPASLVDTLMTEIRCREGFKARRKRIFLIVEGSLIGVGQHDLVGSRHIYINIYIFFFNRKKQKWIRPGIPRAGVSEEFLRPDTFYSKARSLPFHIGKLWWVRGCCRACWYMRGILSEGTDTKCIIGGAHRLMLVLISLPRLASISLPKTDISVSRAEWVHTT